MIEYHRQNIRTQRLAFASFLFGFTFATFLVSMVTPIRAGEIDPVLKERIEVYSDIVTLGDIFEDAGTLSDIAVFRSPDLGHEGMVRGERITLAAKKHGLIWSNPGRIDKVLVRRPSRFISLDEMRKCLAERIAIDENVDDLNSLKITFAPRTKPLHVAPKLTADFIVKRLKVHPRSGKFQATLGLTDSLKSKHNITLSGRVSQSVMIAVPTRVVDVGEVLSSNDVKLISFPKKKLKKGIAKLESALIGKAAKRQLMAETPVPSKDLEVPKLVHKNSRVEIIFQSNGLVLKTAGKVLEDGEKGKAVKVMNAQSERTILATVIGPNLLSVSHRALSH